MTSSLIPYSFTPGTKAKAQEVNANFIALAEKIETNAETIEENKSTAAADTAKCAKKDGNETYTGTKLLKTVPLWFYSIQTQPSLHRPKRFQI